MLRNVFFYNLNNLSNVSAFFAIWFGSIPKVGAGVIAEIVGPMANIDGKIDTAYKSDSDQTSRWLYGYASINWVYDLFRPDEPYAARGSHPSGDGSVARYITLAQLTGDERQYLLKQGWLNYLNLLSPLLYGFTAFPLGNTGIEWNVALRHYLTSFGSDIPAQILLKNERFNMLFTYHSYQNYEHYFPAVEAELVEFPLRIGNFTTYLSPRVLIGMQPKGQEFLTTDPEFLGLIGLRADFGVSKHFFPYFDVTAKTNGWVAGNEFLDGNVSFKLGVSARL
jgi:hypothetical protein